MDIENFIPKICVIGLGGAGGNAVDNMISGGVEGVEFITANTDVQSLKNSLAPNKIQLGRQTTQGFGAGSKPEIGERAAKEAINDIDAAIEGANILFLAGGLGGGTGSGALPIVAEHARSKGILTAAIITTPFNWEGDGKAKIADAALSKLEPHCDCLIVVANQNLFKATDRGTSFKDAFKLADSVLFEAVKTITDLIMKPGIINLDFADIRTVMENKGRSIIGVSVEAGEARAIKAVENALSNPLFAHEKTMGATGLLVNISGNPDTLTLEEVGEAMTAIRSAIDTANTTLVQGVRYDSSMGDEIRVAIIATGIGGARTSLSPSEHINFEPIAPTTPKIEEPVVTQKTATEFFEQPTTSTSASDIMDFIDEESSKIEKSVTTPKAPITPTEPPAPKKISSNFWNILGSDSKDSDEFFSPAPAPAETATPKEDNVIPMGSFGDTKKKSSKQMDLVEELIQLGESFELPSIFKK